MRFIVSFQGRRRLVRLVFGKPTDVRNLAGWRTSAETRDDPHLRDALEFRKLATKRWRYYQRANEAATNMAELRRAIRCNPTSETGFLLIARAPWHRVTPVVGCCFCRRSWCNHCVGPAQELLVRLADELKVPVIWGEATRNSAPFYEKVLNLPRVTDHFFVHGETMEYCRQQYERVAN